jgi:predicted RNA-binding protein with RPS1 domain
MALIKNFVKEDREHASLHQAIEAKYIVFERDGRIILQIDTYGRSTREFPGKLSQTFQLDRDAARELFDILRQEFHFQP